MNWVLLSLIAAVFLGFYELFTKHAVRANAVLPVLFLSTVCGATVWLGLMGLGAASPGFLPASLTVDPLTLTQHLQLALKSLIVATSWLGTYFAMKHLPLSIASPIRATGPVWTFVAALMLLGERPTGLEMLGMGTTIASFIGLSLAGRQEGIHFHRDRSFWFLIAGTGMGVVSSLYDKYLLGTLHFRAPTVQAWFSIYLAVIFLIPAIGWKFRWWQRNQFHWRWSIPLIALSLLVSDYLYFTALRQPEALISLVYSLRRASTLVAFAGSIYLFKEGNAAKKLPAVLGILVGIILTIVG
jgi:drug/metabolite transporter (DMT)-like permease